ncbi:uncharacterized protein LOC120635525 [Pararge aegeria]|uniref:uncharacterized protein LOC120635525 n=1 Tax=Pararge aegeria TaxID=116150 RepID=UPI0019D1E006|nr:uncharacterized protein LOC120635525 [Pararge aegeria]
MFMPEEEVECSQDGPWPALTVIWQRTYRPIVLIDEVSKMLERILASRINQHLAQRGPDISEHQYGFRAGKSTIDAVGAHRAFCKFAKKRGEGVLAVSLDIDNAFGTLPFSV